MAATKSAQKSKTKRQNSYNYKYGLYAAGLFVASYGFASWAIDSGSIPAHIFAFACVYAGARFIMMTFRKQ